MNDPLVSFNTPFQSGDGLCYPTYPKNYYKTQYTPMYGGRKNSNKKQRGGNNIGDYSQPSTINDYPGNAYLTSPNQKYALTGSGIPQQMNPLTENFLNNNMGITYATQAGGRKKYNKKGGVGANQFNGSVDQMSSTQNENSGTLNRAKKQTGGYNIVAEEEMMKHSFLSEYSPKQGMYPVLSGGRKKYNKKGGNQPPISNEGTMPSGMPSNMSSGMPSNMPSTMPSGMQTNMPSNMPSGMQTNMPSTMPSGMQNNMPSTMPSNMPSITPPTMPSSKTSLTTMASSIPNNMQSNMPSHTPAGIPSNITPTGMITESFMSGGRYKKYNTKGGNTIFTPGANFSSQPAEIATQMNPLAQSQHIPRGGFAMKSMSGVDAQMAASDSVIFDEMMGGYKKSSRKSKGGAGSDFATTLSSRGPSNYPDQPTADRFRYFNKTGTFIPNSQLQFAAAPILTGYSPDQNPYPMAYNDYIGGAKKKPVKKSKTTAASKKKKSTSETKAAASKKKKPTTTKKPATKNKTSSNKKK